MARIVKKKTVKRVNWSGVVQLIFGLALILSFVSAVFVRSENAKLARAIERSQIEIVQLERNNDEILRDVNALGDYANIVEKAEQAGLQHFTDNSVFVRLGE